MEKKRGKGRPIIEIDKVEFEKLCGLQCTLIEIAGWFNCSEDTIENWCKKTYDMIFSDVYRQKRSKGKISLRRTQFNLAETSPAMAIFLGKNYLGQRDKFEVDNTKEITKVDELLLVIRENATIEDKDNHLDGEDFNPVEIEEDLNEVDNKDVT